MAAAFSNAIGSTDDLLPNYYAVLNVPYYSSPDIIQDAFLRLASDTHAFQNHKRVICDAFVCLASSGDRAAYDAFYFHTPCWYAKSIWLSYRDERRRLAWGDTAKTNTAFLSELQKAVQQAFAGVGQAGDTATAGRQGPANTAAKGARSKVSSTGPAAEQPAAPSPSKRALKQRRARQRKRAREKEQLKEAGTKEGDGGKSFVPKRAGSSDSGQSDKTLVAGLRTAPVPVNKGVVNGTATTEAKAKGQKQLIK